MQIQVRASIFSSAFWSGANSLGMLLINLLRILILTKFVSEGDLGLFAISMSIMELIQGFSDGGIGAAIVQRQEISSRQLSSLYWFNVMLGFTLGVLTCLVGPALGLMFNEPGLLLLLCYAGLIVAITPFGQQYQFILQKHLDFRHLAISNIGSGVLGLLLTTVLASYGWGIHSLFLGMIANAAFRVVSLFAFGCGHHVPSMVFDASDLTPFLKFGLFLTAERFFNRMGKQLDTLLIGTLLGKEVAGVYYLAKEIVFQIPNRTSAIITNVAFPLLARVQADRNRIADEFCSLIRVVAIALFPVIVGIAVVVPDVVEVFMDTRWNQVVPIVRILSVGALIAAVGSPVGSLFLAIGRADVGFYVNAVLILTRAFCISLMSYYGTLGVASGVVFSGIIGFVIWLQVTSKLAGLRPFRYVESFTVPALASVFMGGVAHLGAIQFQHPFYSLLSAVIAGGMCYVLYLAVFERELLTRLSPSVGTSKIAKS